VLLIAYLLFKARRRIKHAHKLDPKRGQIQEKERAMVDCGAAAV
jgi:hypothetical protein